MKIVIDTNILMSAIMNAKGVTGTFLLSDLNKYEKYSCYYLYVEVFDKKEKIIRYAGLKENELLELLYLTIKKIHFINENQISKLNWDKAKQLTEDIDIKDISFVALSIELDAKLWTGDKKLYTGLRKKGFENVVDAADLKELINK